MMQVSINLDDSGLRSLMARWMVKKRKTIEDGLLISARTLCKAFMDFSLPRNNIKMERAVMSDVSRAYASMSKIYLDIRSRDPEGAEAFWYFQKIGKYATAQKIMAADSPTYSDLKIQPFDGGAAHKAARGARGHVPKGAKPAFVVKNSGKLTKYIAGKQANVGMVKAGWLAAWRDLGRVRDVPQWVRRIKGGTLGSAQKQLQGQASQHIIVHNAVRHADEAIDQRYQNTIEAEAADRLAKYFKIQLGLLQPK
jgi:hypothetical protein